VKLGRLRRADYSRCPTPNFKFREGLPPLVLNSNDSNRADLRYLFLTYRLSELRLLMPPGFYLTEIMGASKTEKAVLRLASSPYGLQSA
jgi:hypothetical protein